MKNYFAILGRYNRWMNEKLLVSASALSKVELNRNCGAFFSSVIGTFNHIYVADLIWLRRFVQQCDSPALLQALDQLPVPLTLNETFFDDILEFGLARKHLDALIMNWVQQLAECDLDQYLSYENTAGVPQSDSFGAAVLHFFNHQTHHRGQFSTLMHQAGADVGVTDLIAMVRNER